MQEYRDGSTPDCLALACINIFDSIELGAEFISFKAIERLAIHYEKGAEKYHDRNWELGGKLSRHFNSAMRHIFKAIAGMTDEDHESAAVWNLFCIMHHEVMIKRGIIPAEFDDMPHYSEETFKL
jgi:hypothetical protein